MVIFWFQLFNAFSGSNLIDGINLFTYNLLFTSVPVIVVAVGDQDLKAEVLLEGKVFYEQGRCSKVYTRWKFWLTILDAFYESAVVFFVAYGVREGGRGKLVLVSVLTSFLEKMKFMGVGVHSPQLHHISFYTHSSSLEGAKELKFVPFCSSRDAFSDGIIFCPNQNFQILAENHGL